jgi:hypothetical protein
MQQSGFLNLVSTLPVVYLALILCAFVLTKMAAHVPFKRLDIVPASGQI